MGRKKRKHRKHDRHGDGAPPFVIPPQVAGIAAAAIEQVNTPAFRQMVAGALGAAAQAFDQRRRPAAAAPPAGPPPAGSPHAEPLVVEPDRACAEAAGIRLSPEATQAIEQAANQAARAVEGVAALASQAIGTAAAALERWSEQQARSGTPANRAGEQPPG